MIVVVDYGAANLLSITRALEAVGAQVMVSGEPADILAAAGVALPGVGAAGSAMRILRETGAERALRQVAEEGRPLLGVCLGLQLFFERLAEDDATGLGLLRGEVPALDARRGKIPHMGWNALHWDTEQPSTAAQAMFAGIAPGMYGYFVHSFHCAPVDDAVAVAWTEYGGPLCAAVARGRLWGTQFHPEKSGAAGLRLLANWLRLTGETAQMAADVAEGAGGATKPLEV